MESIINGIRGEFDKTRIALFTLDNLVWPLLLLSLISFSVLLPNSFPTYVNLRFLLFSSAALGAIVLAESLCLLSGNFDLSVGSIAGFSGVFTAMFVVEWVPQTPGSLSVLIVLIVGGLIGLMNGFSIAIMGVNPFLQTLSFFIIFRSAVTLLTTSSITNLPASYTYLGGEQVFDIPIAVIVILIIYLVTWIWLKYFRTGLAIYAVGGDEDSSEAAGINSTRVIMMVFTLSGILSAFGGMLFVGFLGTATPSLAANSVFQAFAAAVIGGISLFGGRGNVLNAFGGVLLLASIEAGLVMLQLGGQVVATINGIILLLAILIYTHGESYRERVLSA